MACGRPFLVFKPIDNMFLGIPLVHMQLRDLLNALTGQHEDAHRAGVRRVHRHVRTLKPAVKLHEFVPIEPAGAGGFRFVGMSAAGLLTSLKRRGEVLRVIDSDFRPHEYAERM